MNHAAVREREAGSRGRICGLCGCGFTSVHVEVIGGREIFACRACLEKASTHNFIWLCLQCGKVYLKPKKLVIEQAGDMELRSFYVRSMNDQFIQGIDRCTECESQEAAFGNPVPG